MKKTVMISMCYTIFKTKRRFDIRHIVQYSYILLRALIYFPYFPFIHAPDCNENGTKMMCVPPGYFLCITKLLFSNPLIQYDKRNFIFFIKKKMFFSCFQRIGKKLHIHVRAYTNADKNKKII